MKEYLFLKESQAISSHSSFLPNSSLPCDREHRRSSRCSFAQKSETSGFCTFVECKHAAAVQNKDAFNREFCSVLSASSRATFECLLLALQADLPLPRLEFGLHAAPRCALFHEQARADAADFVFPAFLTVAEAAACAQLLAITGKATDMFSLAFSPGFLRVLPGFLQRARLALDSGVALAEQLVWELVNEVIPLLSLFLKGFVLVVESRILNGISGCVPAVAEEIAFM